MELTDLGELSGFDPVSICIPLQGLVYAPNSIYLLTSIDECCA